MELKMNHKLLLAAFCGGMSLSLLELMNMMFHSPQDINVFFFGGMTIAGGIGIIGYFLAGDANIRSAFLSGIAAPQILGGVLKTGATVGTHAGVIFSIFGSPVYANEPIDTIIQDTTMTITVEGTREVITVKDLNTNKEYKASYHKPAEIPFSNSIEVTTITATGEKVKVNKDYSVDEKKRLNIIVIEKHKTKSIFRGLFPQQQQQKLTQKLHVQQMNEPIPIADTIDTTAIDSL